MSGVARSRLYESIVRYVKNIAPGLIYTLDLHCRRLAGKDCVALFLDEPWTLRDILVNIYGSSPTLEMVARMFIYPAKLEVNIDDSLEALVKLFLEKPAELYRVLQRIVKQ